MITISDAESQAREQRVLCARALHRIRMYDLAGHIGLPIPENPNSDHAGRWLDKSGLTGADIVIIDPNDKQLSSGSPPSLETPIHTVILAARAELESVTTSTPIGRRC